VTALDIAALTLYTFAAITFALGCWYYLERARLTVARSAVEGQMKQAREDRALREWCNFTMLSVTDSKGYIYAATLRQLHTTGMWERVWDAPVAVAFWYGNPDTIERYRNELDQEHPGD
jgi:hypothetical protein